MCEPYHQRHALDLPEEVALKTTEAASIKLDDIGALIVNTITGLAIPSLDAKLMNRLRLPRSVERLPIFGLGCGGGVGGLARAARCAQAVPVGAHVLFLTIDLCSLCLRIADPSLGPRPTRSRNCWMQIGCQKAVAVLEAQGFFEGIANHYGLTRL